MNAHVTSPAMTGHVFQNMNQIQDDGHSHNEQRHGEGQFVG